MLCVHAPNTQGIPGYMLHAQDVRQSSILWHSSMHPEHALPGMDPKVLCCLGCPRLLGIHLPNGLDASWHSASPCASVVQEAHIWGWGRARMHGTGNPCLMLACMGMLAVWNLEHKGRALFLPLSGIQIIQQAQSIKFQPYTVLAVPKACPCTKAKTSKAVGSHQCPALCQKASLTPLPLLNRLPPHQYVQHPKTWQVHALGIICWMPAGPGHGSKTYVIGVICVIGYPKL